MKSRDIIGLIIAGLIFLAAGIIFYTQLAPVPKGTGITVEVPPKVVVPLASEISQSQMVSLKKLQDYARPQEIRVCTSEGDKGCVGKNGIFQP